MCARARGPPLDQLATHVVCCARRGCGPGLLRAVVKTPIRSDFRMSAAEADESSPRILFRIQDSTLGGRGLFATQPIKPGTEVFIERPAYHTPCADGKTDEQEGHEALAAHIVASSAPPHRQAIDRLVSNIDDLRQQEPRRLAVEAAVGPVRAIISSMPIDQALAIVSPSSAFTTQVPDSMRETIGRSLASLARSVNEERVWQAYGRDWSNAMAVFTGLSATRRGSALYPQSGAVMNHSNSPNCFLVFDDDWTLRVRCISPVARGDELTHSYMELGRPYEELRAELLRKYCFDVGPVDERGAQRYLPGASASDDARVEALASTYDSGRACVEPAALIPAITAAMHRRQRAQDWQGVVSASDDLLHCYRYAYRVLHPQVAFRLLSAGLACLRLEADVASRGASSKGASADPQACAEQEARHVARRAARYLTQAHRMLCVTHGEGHALAASALRALERVSSALEQALCVWSKSHLDRSGLIWLEVSNRNTSKRKQTYKYTFA